MGGVNILLFVIWSLTPGQDDKLLTLFVSACNTVCMVVCRGFAWIYNCYSIGAATFAHTGYWGFAVIAPALLIFTTFNVTLIKLMSKNTIKNYHFYIDERKKKT